MDNKKIKEKERVGTVKKRNVFLRFMHCVFVKNIGYKFLALILGVTVVVLSSGLGL